MKVAHFIDSPDPGGAESMVVELCRRLPERGFECEIIHCANPWIEARCREFGIPGIIAPADHWYRSGLTLPLFALAFSRFLRRRGIRVLHSHLFGAVVGGALTRLAGGPAHLGTLHDIYTVEEKPGRLRWLKLAARTGTRLVTVSEQMRERFHTLGGDSLPLARIYNGVDPEPFTSVQNIEKKAARTELSGDGPEPAMVLINVARLVDLKRHDLMIQAVARLDPELGIHLAIAGDGPLRAQLTALIDKLGCADRVRILGFRDDVPALLAGADGFVLASDTEGLSCSILEAMAAGLPVVATDVGGNRELVTDGETGYLIPPDDVDALAVALTALAQDPARRKVLAAGALAKVRQQFSIDNTLDAYSALYRELGGG